MEIKTFKKLKDNRYKLTMDNGECVILFDDIIIEYNLLISKVIDEEILKEIIKANDKKEAYYVAVKMLSNKMRTRKEITKQLKKHDYDDKTIEEVIKRLYQERYLSDSRYINAYINDQLNLTDKGPIKITKELVALGFREEIIRDYLSKLGDEIWEVKINKIIEKKMKLTTNLSAYSLRHKIIVDLINKGHYKDLIMNLIDNYEFKENEETLKKEFNKIKNKLEAKYEGHELRFFLRAKLLNKGFTSEDIERLLNEN